MALSAPMEKTNDRGAEAVFSPQATAKPDATFRSPKPTKQSAIRVVTRIRPLLPDEIVRGRKASITPIPCASNLADKSATNPAHNEEAASFSPHSSQSTKFRPSKIQPPSLQDGNILPIKSPSFLPPKSSSRSASPRAAPPSTSLHASLGPNSKKQFDFDAVLGEESTQQQVYASSVGDKILKHVFRGISVTCMCYGQTNAGKSYTMQGLNDSENVIAASENKCPNGPSLFYVGEHDGIIPRAIHDLFKGKMEYRSSGKGSVSIDMTFFELYNDELKDLLQTKEDDSFRALKMVDQGENGVFIEGLTTVPVHSAEQAHQLIKYAAERRATASTYLNIQSSRSHAICTLTVSITPFGKSRGAEHTQAKLTLVDLAGSERIKKSGVIGVQQQESITINKDLFVLGKVVAALADKSRTSAKEKHVAYRDSKLTRLLRESLGGNCFTVFISCVSPADFDIEETMNTLRYAERARSISNSIKRNVSQAILTRQECTALTEENRRLKVLVNKLKKRVAAEISRDAAGSLLDQEEDCTGSANTPSEILRLDSQSTASSFSPDASEVAREKRPDKPIWMHFQDLAKITKNVTIPTVQVAIPTANQPEAPREIELGERVDPKVEADRNIVLKPVLPERCSYESACLPCGNEDDIADEVEGKTSTHPTESSAEVADEAARKIQEQVNSLRKELNALKFEHGETLASLLQRKQELESVSEQVEALGIHRKEAEGSAVRRKKELQSASEQAEALRLEQSETEASILQQKQDLEYVSRQVESTRAVLDNKNQELSSVASQVSEKRGELERAQSAIDALQRETVVVVDREQARRDELREEAWGLERVIEKLTRELNVLDLSSPQRSFSRIWATVDQQRGNSNNNNESNPQPSSVEDTTENLEKHLNSSFKALREQFKKLDLQLDRPASPSSQAVDTSPELTLVDPQSDISRVTDLAATVEEQKKEMGDLSQQLLVATKQRRLSDRNQSMKDTQIACLQEKKSELESAVALLKVEKTNMKQGSEKDSQTIRALESKLASESDRRKSLEESLNFSKEEASRGTAVKIELQDQVEVLRKNVGVVLEEKANLQAQVCTLEERIFSLDSKRETNESQTSERCSTLAILANIAESGSEEMQGESPQSDERDYIRMKTENMLQVANDAICTIGTSSSCCSSAGTEFCPASGNPSSIVAPLCRPPSHEREDEADSSLAKSEGEQVQITNLALVEDHKGCTCSSTLFAEKTEYVEFYLPKINIECTCGHAEQSKNKEADDNVDPCALTSILRPWQVDFLDSEGIHDPVSLVHTQNQRGGALALTLRKWRKAKGLPVIKTKSCGVALHIWARTCKSVVRSVRSQQEQGVEIPRRPEFLELNISENNTAVSSLGVGGYWQVP